ncbi:DUF1761 domain-containing protein [Maritalea mediterranea]|uniref:DUF1761 domain-containing protein n=1 Tax=Maritalea mediterranea TaxID=2909667 RepID=A0ABS9E7D7_9HYPH|nr:DUF1761 domain-containing protein [Maritalea mediterranea]MCF4098795.1 DUF1761 domain-containing protein [Maritalea mediterranea]
MDLNWIAIIGAAIGMQILGALWWMPFMFGKPWMRAMGVTQHDLSLSGVPTGLAYAGAFNANLLIAIGLAVLFALVSPAGLIMALLWAAGTWLAFALSVKTKTSLFEGRTLPIFLISEGQELAAFLLAGGILSVFT